MIFYGSFVRLSRLMIIGAVCLAFPTSAFAVDWKEKVLYSFQGTPDGSSPAGVMVLDKQGNLYGATTAGGSTTCRGPFQCGTVFQLKAPAKKGDAWKETLLYVFKGTDSNDGASPFGGVVWDQAKARQTPASVSTPSPANVVILGPTFFVGRRISAADPRDTAAGVHTSIC